ncbi:hypothetical protein AAVH_14965 [Aphelenchoides avenae]|nr:hypothetical protein AAVH_14965 [Aphelenchus avenae]
MICMTHVQTAGMTILVTRYFLNSHGQLSKTRNSELNNHITYNSTYRSRTALIDAVKEAGGYPTSWNVVSLGRFSAVDDLGFGGGRRQGWDYV